MSETVISSVFICPKCKYTNPSKSKFCMQCGTPLSGTSKEIKTGKIILVEKGVPKKEFSISEKLVIGKENDISIEGADFAKNICEFNLSNDTMSIKILKDGVYLKVATDSTIELQNGSELIVGNKIFRVEF